MGAIDPPTPRTEEKTSYTDSSLLTNAALPAFLGAVLAILTILAGMARIGTGAGRGENVERKLVEEKNRQQELREGDEEP